MKAIFAVAVLLSLGVAIGGAVPAAELSNEQLEWLFSAWMKQHNREYATTEEAVQRYDIWRKNLEWINQENAKELSYKVALNQFGDITNEEYKAMLKSRRGSGGPTSPHKHHAPATKATPPTTWDWRQHGAVNPIQNQGQCGSCWAFTSGDAISGLWAIKTGLLFPVSVQEIVDCSGSEGNQGCNGGEMTSAFQWVIQNGGICDWQEYAYTAETGNCGSTNCTNVATIKSFVSINAGAEADIMAALYGQPLSAVVEADQQSFQFYSSGVLNDPGCGTNVDHGMTLVGWGTDAATGLPYWETRNMWGTSWGEQGYIRLVRGKNMCGIAEGVTYPTL